MPSQHPAPSTQHASSAPQDSALSTQHSASPTLHSPLAWSAYLACSWTWCIGMFLPVLLVRDYGLAGWVVFAIPNCLGAAAMGWVLARPGSSERIVAEHRTAAVAFSAVTLAFHAFFLCWMTRGMIHFQGCIAAAVVGSALAVILRSDRRLDLILAWIVLAISLFVLTRAFADFTDINWHGSKDPRDLFWLAPICIFGFALCPYLDLTFHRAKQATSSSGGKWAFSLGFGLFFLAMIVLTFLYSGDFARGLKSWIAVHIAVQTGFTWMAHLRALPRAKRSDLAIWIAAGILALTSGSVLWIPSSKWFTPGTEPIPTGETIYRMFMGFYGLVFPAYVWVCMVPIGGRSPGPIPRAVFAWASGVLIAAPMFWMGFIQGKMAWLGLGLTVVLLSRCLASKRHRQKSPLALVS